MTDKDKLDGYRGIRPPALRKAMDESDQDRLEKGNTLRRYILGVAVEKLMTACASRDEVSLVIASLVTECEDFIKDAMSTLISMHDLSSPEARSLHFETRVRAQLITMLNERIEAGRAAGATMEADRTDS